MENTKNEEKKGDNNFFHALGAFAAQWYILCCMYLRYSSRGMEW